MAASRVLRATLSSYIIAVVLIVESVIVISIALAWTLCFIGFLLHWGSYSLLTKGLEDTYFRRCTGTPSPAVTRSTHCPTGVTLGGDRGEQQESYH